MKTITFTGFTGPVFATGVLTASGTPTTSTDTVTIGTKVYTFKTTPTVEGDVKINGQDGSLTNLASAINHTGTPGTDYVCAAANAQVSSSAVVTHAITLTALNIGGNSIVTTEASSALSFGSGTLTGGNDAVSITGTTTDVTYGIPSQQVTVQQINTLNPNWSRALRVNTSAVQILRFGSVGAAIDINSLATLIGVGLEPTLTWPISVTTQPVAASCVHSSTAAVFTVGILANEVTTTYQWQESTIAGGSTFTNLSNGGIYGGVTTNTLTITPTTTGKTGFLYQCVCTNAAGNVTSGTALLTIT